MENSQSILNKFITQEKIKNLIHINTRAKLLPTFILLISIIFILSAYLIRLHTKNQLSFSSYSNVMLTSLMIFVLCMSYIPIYMSSIRPPYYFMAAIFLQILNIILYDEFMKKKNNDSDSLFTFIIIFQTIVLCLYLFEYYK